MADTVVEVTPEMLAAGWAVLRRDQPHGKILGQGPALREAYLAMAAVSAPQGARSNSASTHG